MGYAGRFALLETMPLNEELQRLIIQGKSALDIKLCAMHEFDMITLRRCAVLNAIRGNTSIEEVLRVTNADEARSLARRRIAAISRSMGSGPSFPSTTNRMPSASAKSRPIPAFWEPCPGNTNAARGRELACISHRFLIRFGIHLSCIDLQLRFRLGAYPT